MASIINATTTNGVAISADNSGILQLATNSGTTAVTIDASQNVGIGTSSPITNLTIATGNSPSSTYIPLLVKGGNAGVGGDGGGIAFSTSLASAITSASQAASAIRSLNSYGSESNGEEGSLAFYTNHRTGANTYTGLTEKMRIDSSGNVLVGITVTTQTPVTGMNVTPQGNVGIGHVTGTVSGSNYITFNYNGTLIGQVYQNGTNAVAYATSSDYRLKDNVLPMTGALEKVSQLKPVTYKWKSDGSDGQGFIAHELQAVVPDCVHGEKDAVETYTDEEGNEQTRIKPQGIDTSFLVATLTAAIQEQQALITTLQTQITALNAKVGI